MTSAQWRATRNGAPTSRLLAAILAAALMIATMAPGLALSASGSETTATPEPEVAAPPAESAEGGTAEVAPPEVDPAPSLAGVQPSLEAAAVGAGMFVAAAPGGNFSREWKQFANEVGSEQWIGGAVQQNKADYREGMSVPQRLVLKGINSPDAGHYVTFEHQFTKAGKYAYDFITSWDQAVGTAAEVAGQTWAQNWKWMGIPTADVALLDNYYVDVSIPGNGWATQQESAFESALGYGNRTLRVYSDQPISNVHVTMDPALHGSLAADSSLFFKVSWDGPADHVMILYASHIANGIDPYLPHTGIGWGPNAGASAISGAPYHNKLSTSSEWTGDPSEDNQLMAGTVGAMSGIVGKKFSDLDGDGVYPPEAGEPGLGGWEIWADLGGTEGVFDAGIDAKTTTLANGTYGLYFQLPSQTATDVRVYEVQQSGWAQTYPTAAYHVVNAEPSSEDVGVDFGNYFNLPPVVRITKTASPTVVPETGGTVAFTFLIENTGTEDFTLSTLSDSKLGDLKDEAEAAWVGEGKTLPIALAVGGSWSFNYTSNLAADDLAAHTNVVTVAVADDDGDTDDATDDATVTFTDVAPTISVTKTASPTHIPEAGGYVTYTVTVTNTGPEDVTLTSLIDDKFGDLNGVGTLSVPQTILVGGSYIGEFNKVLSSDSLAPHTNTVTAWAVDDEGTTATASDDATVTFDDLLPTILVTKTAGVSSVAEPGADVVFTVNVTNPASAKEAVWLSSLVDSVYGDLNGKGTIDLTPSVQLEPGQSYMGTFTGAVMGDAGSTHVNVVTARASDNEGNTATATDDASVSITDVMPAIVVEKSASPTTLPEPGGLATFTVTVTNPASAVEPVWLSSLVDDVYGNLDGKGTIDVSPSVMLAPGQSYTGSFTAPVSGNAGESHTDTITGTATDNEGNPATDTDSATVLLTDVMPSLIVEKSASPTILPEPGGLATFTVTVTNPASAVEPVWLSSLVDDVYGNLDGKGTVDVSPPVMLAPGASYSATFPGAVMGDAGSVHTDVITGTAADDEGNPATDTGTASVTLRDVKPTIVVTKTATPRHIPEGGAYVAFTVTVENPASAVEAVWLSSLVDSVFGNLDGKGTIDLTPPVKLDPGQSYTGSFGETLASDMLVPHTNVVTATAHDNEGNAAVDDDDETVTFEDTPPEITVTKTANPTHVPETGGNVTFTVTVKNTGDEAVTLTSAIDSVFGPIALSEFSTTELAVGETATASFTEWLDSDSLAAHTNVVTVTAEDNDGTPDSDSDDATVTFDDAAPRIRITKTASPTHVPETGGNVTFTFLVENIGVEDVTLTELTDTVFGDMDGKGTVALPQTLLVGGSYSASYTVWLESDSLDPHNNVATATAVDDDGTTASDDDDADVTFDDVAPLIRVTKTATPRHIPEGGAYVSFTVLVENIGVEDVTLTSLIDSVFGDLDGQGTIVLPQTILVGGSYSASFAKWLDSDNLDPHTNVVTATAVDDDGTPVTDDDDETVTFEDTPPEITVTKTANPTHVPETGGNVTFTVTVKNTGDEAVTLTSAIDSVFGPIALSEFSTTELAVGETATASFTEWLDSDSLAAHTNVVTVTAEDNDGTPDSDSDDATVTFDDLLPVISVVKLVDRDWMIMPGGTFHYTAKVTNDSAEPVHVMKVTDSLAGTVYEWKAGDPEIWLEPEASRDFSFALDHTAPGTYGNIVTVEAQDDDGNSDTAQAEASVVVTNPAIQVVKTSDAPDGVIERGGQVTYTYVVKNIGDVDLFGIVLEDDKLGTIGTLEKLLVGESSTFTKSTTLDDGVTNIATVTARDGHQNEVSDTDDETVETFLRFTELDLAIIKSADRSTAEPGDLVTYTLTYWNNGTMPATDITIVDDFDERYATVVNAGGGVVSGGSITWKISGPLTLADGKRTISYTVRIAEAMPDGTTNVDNVVVISHPDDDDDSNNRSSRRVVVQEPLLPFTGGEYVLLLLAAIAASVVGLGLRRKPRVS